MQNTNMVRQKNDTENDVNHNENMENTLIGGMKRIFEDRKLSKSQYMELNSHVYSNCIRDKEITVWIQNRGNTNTNVSKVCLLQKLAQLIQYFLNDHIQKISMKTPDLDVDCLQYYCAEWINFRWSSKVLNGVCKYLNEQNHKLDPDAKSIEEIALRTWYEHLFTHLNEKVSTAAIRMLRRNRDGQEINSTALNAVIESYIDLGFREWANDLDDSNHLSAYKAFENRVIEATEEYYNKESEKSMEDCYIVGKSLNNYILYAQNRFNDELKRAKLLHPTTHPKLMQVCSDALIAKHSTIFESEFHELLKADKIEDMGKLYSLAVESEFVIKQFYTIFQNHVSKIGLDEIEKHANKAVKDPVLYIDIMLSVHKNYHNLVYGQFKGKPGFLAALDKACSEFINRNAVVTISGSNRKSVESLTAYCHKLLKKSSKNMEEDDLEMALNKMMVIFRYVEDKDVFEDLYKRKLAERLISELSTSDDAEASMISKLKHACGFDYTKKLQSMYQDIDISKDLNEKFREIQKLKNASLPIDFRIKVLKLVSWPFDQGTELTLPQELAHSIDCFINFYLGRHSGRKLMWLHKLSKIEVHMKNNRGTRYTIKANTLQAAVLLQFNEQTSFTVQQLQNNTGIDKKYLTQLIESLLVKTTLFKATDTNNLNEDSSIELNVDYNEPKLRLDITAKSDLERKADQTKTNHKINENRSFLIDAAIVRVMKMRRTLNYQTLIIEVLNQLASKFAPKIGNIKKQIEKLIEKEYIERDQENRDTYNYLA